LERSQSHERGLRLPADCSVVGCDDLSFAAYLVLLLTTVRKSWPLATVGDRPSRGR
jgi:DNA-binding LacI/PurR family transcriptional regulator